MNSEQNSRPNVLQNWVIALPLMMQTTLLTSVRGPDGCPKYGPTKMLLRWYRRCFLVAAMEQTVLSDPHDPRGGSFMGPSIPEPLVEQSKPGFIWEIKMDNVLDQYLRELDSIPHHFQMHLLHSAEILGYKHSDPRIRKWWYKVYRTLVNDLHLRPEPEEVMDERLGGEEGWRKHNNKATQE